MTLKRAKRPINIAKSKVDCGLNLFDGPVISPLGSAEFTEAGKS
jgi:hypothetical protein